MGFLEMNLVNFSIVDRDTNITSSLDLIFKKEKHILQINQFIK